MLAIRALCSKMNYMREPFELPGDAGRIGEAGAGAADEFAVTSPPDAEANGLLQRKPGVPRPEAGEARPGELATEPAADELGVEAEVEPERQALPEPVEGVDYFVDLYKLVGAKKDDDTESLSRKIRAKSKEYSPDRQHGTAEEFGARADRVMKLVNRAREVLLDEEKRLEYDDMLAEWQGPISDDGTPVTTFESIFARQVVGKDTEQVEEIFKGLKERIEAHPGIGTDGRVARAERRLDKARQSKYPDEEEIRDLQDDYEEELFALDAGLAVEENERSRILGREISDAAGRHYRVSIGYAEETANELEQLRTRKVEEHAAIATGSFATRLAILSGEVAPSTDVVPQGDVADYALPPYYDDQAAKVKALAEKRLEIMKKRLGNLKVDQPEAALQTELSSAVFVGLTQEGYEGADWYTSGVPEDDGGEEVAPPVDAPDSVLDDLLAGNYAAVIAAGYNVITTKRLQNIEDDALVRGAVVIHAKRYGRDFVKGAQEKEPDE